MVHAAMAAVQPGEVLVLTMPEPRPVALVGDLLATQAKAHGAAAILIDAAVRDVDELAELGLPIWARWVRVKGAGKDIAGSIGDPVTVGGATINQGDILILDADGVAIVEPERVDEVLEASREREKRERIKRLKLQAGELSYDLDGLRDKVETADVSRRADPRSGPHRPRRAAHAIPRRQPALLRRAVRDGDRAPGGPVGVPARLGRVPALRPEADRVRASRAGSHRDPRLEPRGAGAPGRTPSSRPGSAPAGTRATTATDPRTSSRTPTGTRSRSSSSRIATFRPSTCAPGSRTCPSATSTAAPRSSASTT